MNKRKIIALVIVLVGVFGFFLIIKSGEKNSLLSADDLNFKAKISPTLNFELQPPGLPSIKGEQGQSFSITKENLTDIAAQAYINEVLKINSGGPIIVDGQPQLAVPSEKILSEILEGQLLTQELKYSTYEFEDLKIGNDNSTRAQLAYLETVSQLYQKRFPNINKSIFIALQNFFEKDDSSLLNQIISIVPSHINNLLSVEVPPAWKLFHLQMVNLWQKKLTVYQAIASIEIDPIKGYIAVQQMEEIIQEDLQLQKTADERYKELNS